MTETDKIPLKRAELSVQKFNEVAIPHHLGLLKNHKSNIEKCLALGDWTKIRKEEINAVRVIKQLKNLLLEMDVLRNKVEDKDVEKFDKMVSHGRQQAQAAMEEYLKLKLNSPSTMKSSFDSSTTDVDAEIGGNLPQIQAEFQSQEHMLRARQACLEEFETLHREVEDLHAMFQNVSEIVHEQGEHVDIIAENAEEALENVMHGETNLRVALRYKKTLYPVIGALMGTCIGGPIGLIAGLKVGGLAAVGCGILGFTGGSVLKSNEVAPGIKEEKAE